MARIRTIKPEAMQHRKVGKLSDRAFRLWMGMLTQADDSGRLVVDAEQFRVLFFAYQRSMTAAKVAQALNEILDLGLINLYELDGNLYGCFPSWRDHQKLSHPSPSRLPAPEDSRIVRKFSEDSGLAYARGPKRNKTKLTKEQNETRPDLPGVLTSAGDPPLPCQEIIDYLNQKAGTNYQATTPRTQVLIKARFDEGFDIEAFKVVIDNQVEAWLNTGMASYLRPETLFGPKFEGYLNRPKVIEQGLTEKGQKNLAAIQEFINEQNND